VIARSISEPLFHFAVVADDSDEGITHVIRGEDHISNTPRQILIQEALGVPRPIYAHIPLILAPDKSKLSKRRHGASVGDLRQEGFLPEAIINFLGLLGWNPGDDRELYTLSELMETFSLDGVQKSGAVFNEEKLKWFNREYLKQLAPKEQVKEIAQRFAAAGKEIDTALATRLAPSATERIATWQEVETAVREGEWDYVFTAPSPDPQNLTWKDSTPEDTRKHLSWAEKALSELSEASYGDLEAIKAALWTYAEEQGKGAVLWPLRYALTGKDKSPDPFTVAYIIGKDATVERIKSALELIA